MARSLGVDSIVRVLGVVVAALYAPLWVEFRGTPWGGYLYATLVLGGVVVLFLLALGAIESVVTSVPGIGRLARSAVPRASRTSNSVHGTEITKKGAMVWVAAAASTFTVGFIVRPLFLPELPSWESFLAGTAIGGVAGGVAAFALAAILGVGRDASDNSEQSIEGLKGPRWLEWLEKWLYWLLVLAVMFVMLTLTRKLPLPIWPTFAAVMASAGLLALFWRRIVERFRHGPQANN